MARKKSAAPKHVEAEETQGGGQEGHGKITKSEAVRGALPRAKTRPPTASPTSGTSSGSRSARTHFSAVKSTEAKKRRPHPRASRGGSPRRRQPSRATWPRRRSRSTGGPDLRRHGGHEAAGRRSGQGAGQADGRFAGRPDRRETRIRMAIEPFLQVDRRRDVVRVREQVRVHLRYVVFRRDAVFFRRGVGVGDDRRPALALAEGGTRGASGPALLYSCGRTRAGPTRSPRSRPWAGRRGPLGVTSSGCSATRWPCRRPRASALARPRGRMRCRAA